MIWTDADAEFPADQAWPLVQRDLQWFIDHGNGKKMYFDEVRRPLASRPDQHPDILSWRDSEWMALRDLSQCSA